MMGEIDLLLSTMPDFLSLGTEYHCLRHAQHLAGRFIEVTNDEIFLKLWRQTYCYKMAPPLVAFVLVLDKESHPSNLMWMEYSYKDEGFTPRKLLPLAATFISLQPEESTMTLTLADGKRQVFQVYGPKDQWDAVILDWEPLCFLRPQKLEITTVNDGKKNKKSVKLTATERNQIKKEACTAKPHVNVTLNGVKIRALLDTGATCSVISSDVFFKHWTNADLRPLPYDREAGGISGHPVRERGYFKPCINIRGTTYQNKVVIVCDMGSSEKMLVGMNIIKDLKDLIAMICPR